MRRSARMVSLVAGLLVASSVLSSLPGGVEVSALTESVWVGRSPNPHRFVGSALSANGSIGFIVSDYQNGTAHRGRVLRSTDSGATWTVIEAITEGAWRAVATSADGQAVVAVGSTTSGTVHKVMVSSDAGATWTDRTPASPVAFTDVDITADGSAIVVGTASGVIMSTDAGANWSTPATFPSNPHSVAVGLHNGDLVIHAGYSTAVQSWRTGSGSPTSHTVSPAGTVTDISASDDGQVVLAGSRQADAAHVSTNGGTSWTSTEQTGFRVLQLVTTAVSPDGSAMLIASYSGVLRQSSDRGATWDTLDEGANRPWHALSVTNNGSMILTGLENAGIRMRIPTPAPIVTALSRSESPTSGGAQITITGSHFHDVTAVTIGGVPATPFTVASSTAITASIPAGTAGAAAVTVTTAHGSSTLSGRFTYYETMTPAVTSHSPTTGSFLGGTAIDFTGDGLAEVTAVRIGGRPAEIVAVTRTELSVVTPANRIGIMDIELVSPFGTLTITDGWRSQWVARSQAPSWSPLLSDGEPILMWGLVSEIEPDGEGGAHIAGYFIGAGEVPGADAIAHWDGERIRPLAETGGALGLPFAQFFHTRFGITSMLTLGGDLWITGDLDLGGTPSGLMRLGGTPRAWIATSGSPNGLVMAALPRADGTIVVGGDMVDGWGDAANDIVAVHDPDDGSWSPLGGSAFTGDGEFLGGSRAITALAAGPDGRILAGGVFRLDTTAPGDDDDLVAAWDGSGWTSVLRSGDSEVVTSMEPAMIGGEAATIVTTCGIDDDGQTGRVVVLRVDDTTETIGTFDGCVMDATTIEGESTDHVAVAGAFLNETSGSDPVPMLGAALLTAAGWADLGAGTNEEEPPFNLAIAALGDSLLIGGETFEIGGDPDANGIAISSPITYLLESDDVVDITSMTAVEADGSVTVTVTGRGFTDRTDATIDDRPVEGLEIVSATELRFTSTRSSVDRTVTVYGDTSTDSSMLSPPAAPVLPGQPDDTDDDAEPTSQPAADPPAQTGTTTPATPEPPLPSVTAISEFPAVSTLIPTGTNLTPGSPITVTAGGFEPGEEVWIIVASTPRLLGTATVAADGTISSPVTLPTDLLGEHTLVIWSPATGRGVRQPITIASALLPATR